MAEKIPARREQDGRSLFVDGYFSERIFNGEEPKYGYPKNHVPEATKPSMDVVTGFIAALRANKR